MKIDLKSLARAGIALTAVTAVAGAQRALLVAPATVHPFYWAGFVSTGGAR